MACVADVRDEAALENAVATAWEPGPLDLLVTSAGINSPGSLSDTPAEAIREMVDINITGTLLACRAFGRRLVPSRGRPGSVVCVSSQMGAVGLPGLVTYCASKHAVNGLTKALALEWAPHDIRVNAVAPTFVNTPLTASRLSNPAFYSEVVSRIPQGRLGTVDEVVSAILYLLSDEASLITGHVLAVDGGWTAI
jgi:NAD(P)-dependent dehydrogenase (short-subunit alcohol dehydrogenase family)